MKIWNSYGSEHSMNLVIIGKFKEVHDAEEFEVLTQNITKFLGDNTNFNVDADRYDKDTLDYLGKKNLFALSPQQLGHFLYDISISRQGSDIRISSDDDVNGLIALLIHQGAKVEVFSAHDYPDTNK